MRGAGASTWTSAARKPGGTQARRHGLGRLGVVADGVGGVDLDQLAVDLAKGRLLAGPVLGPDGQGRENEAEGQRTPQSTAHVGVLPG